LSMKRRLASSLAFKFVAVASLTVGLVTTVRAAVQQWMDYFQPTPIIGSLSSTCWGAAQVGPRDQSNGLEDKAMKSYNYWDGGIIKDEQTGIYHMFASRWSQSFGHNGWMSDSHCVHATSTNLYGAYTDKGQCFTDNGGMCHNVNALKLRDGDTSGKKFAITCSGSVAGSGRVYGADSLDGPWTYLGDLKLDLNGHTGRYSSGDNFRTILRPDGQYECINGLIGLADNVLGTYKAQMSGKFTDTVPGHIDPSCQNNMEDPYLFYSGSQYHVFYNCWSAKKAYFYSSTDGINWKAEDGYGYDPTSNMVRYTDGTINHWELLERPSVYLEGGHAVAMTFAAINVPKDQDTANSGNGSKVIVVPVDGLSYDSGGPPGSVAPTGGAGGGLDAGFGSGGKGGSGGTTSSGSSTGGTIGTGGATSIATGGNAGTAGRGEGGASAASSAAGGANGSGGKGGSGGTTSSGGSTGGTIGTGGDTSIATGGNAGTAGGGEGGSSAASSAAGGANGTGGRSATGDSAGGARSSGGSSAHSDGGSVAVAGGAVGSLGGGAGHGGAAGSSGKSSGCSCTVGAGRTETSRGPGACLLLLGIGALGWADRQRRRRRRDWRSQNGVVQSLRGGARCGARVNPSHRVWPRKRQALGTIGESECHGSWSVKMMMLLGRNR
jgi:hypothetical protein